MKHIRTALSLLLMLTFITGLMYPLLVTAVAQWCFPWRANGSLIELNGKTVGSEKIGQWFRAPSYFWGRPSATLPFPYNGAASSASGLGPHHPTLLSIITERMTQWQQTDGKIPIDLVTASASGLDPDISPLAAFYQAPRIAAARHLPIEAIQTLIQTHIEPRTFGVLGEPRVNVLQLNIALDLIRTN